MTIDNRNFDSYLKRQVKAKNLSTVVTGALVKIFKSYSILLLTSKYFTTLGNLAIAWCAVSRKRPFECPDRLYRSFRPVPLSTIDFLFRLPTEPVGTRTNINRRGNVNIGVKALTFSESLTNSFRGPASM